MRIVHGGLLSTVQDLGRFGFQHVGVTPSGALDPVSHRLANALVANDEGAATIEVTLRGPAIEFTADALIALCGADLTPTIADMPVPTGHAVAVRAGTVLRSGGRVAGVRCYIAVAGGIAVPEVMGSRSTYQRAAIGGYDGRALRSGDEIAIGSPSPRAREALSDALARAAPLPFGVTARSIEQRVDVTAGEPVRFARGPHHDMLSRADRDVLVNEAFEISPRSDRMGYRLTGPRLSAGSGELLSTGVTWGTVQLPASGEPIVLMADRQTTGGYPIVATVIAADLPRMAQMKPGDTITLNEVGIDEAQEVLRQQERTIEEMKRMIERS